jgi:uncharacterized SAM-binding protein YcdF (DUF218 family)
MNTLFFWLSKLIWFVLSPLNLALILLVIVWLLILSDSKRFIKPLMSGIVITLLFIAILPVGSWLLYPLEKRFITNPNLPESIEGIIILSGSIKTSHSALWQQPQFNEAADRELAFMKLAHAYPNAKLIYSGGNSELLQRGAKASDIAKQLFTELGLETTQILFERQARNTYENSAFSFELAKPEFKQPWILITSAFHMPRSVGVFCKAGWPVLPYPVDHRTQPGKLMNISFNLSGRINTLELALHEWLGLLAYRLSGKTTALLPKQC